MRPVDIEADVHEMERRKRVEAIMNSKVREDGVKSRRLITMFLSSSCSERSWSEWWVTP